MKSNPLKYEETVDLYFLENRARLLEIAAFLDRIDRASDAGGELDYRHAAFVKAMKIVLESSGNRTAAVQLAFSDPTTAPIDSAAGLKAFGAWKGGAQ
jgi:hypothetical protein